MIPLWIALFAALGMSVLLIEFLEQLNDEDAHLFYSLFAKKLLGVTE